jgi:hypothetical protein
LTVIVLVLALGLMSCGDSGASENGASADPFERGFGGVALGEEGSSLTLRQPDGSEDQIGSEVLLGWINGGYLDGDYFKQLRIGTALGTMELWMNFPSTGPPTGLIEGVHQLRPNRLLLENSGDLEDVEVEIFFQRSDPPFDPLTNARGTVEIRENVSAAEETYSIAGEMEIDILGTDGLYRISGYFCARDVDP